MADLKGLCMKCRDSNKKPTMQVMENIKVSEKNNRYSAKGTCQKCKGNMFKFMSKDTAEETVAANSTEITHIKDDK